ncbi:hypothetical protein SAMN05660733_00491 [Lentzea albidocapillata]|uniref:Uncharacterized protein n=1 Tax=Lentzea albidocapillata TaxID=40571 RepID=A0A1W2A513_9PSEU|nr:hypothetical protein SAMN05660733_00491 [Lentzea albidocapillata]
MFVPGQGKGIFVHRGSGDTLHAYVKFSRLLEWFDDLGRIVAEFEGWAPAITKLITESYMEPVFRPHYALLAEHRWGTGSGRDPGRRRRAPHAAQR